MDFWWVDWQQGQSCAAEGMDPLWLLNHFHAQDAAHERRRPFILSRYAGPGSHRYPTRLFRETASSAGSRFNFSRTLRPRLPILVTAGGVTISVGIRTAGATMSCKPGGFSSAFFSDPAHDSTSNPFNGKEPWRYGPEACGIMTAFLRLRHRLIPYLYSMNWRCHSLGE